MLWIETGQKIVSAVLPTNPRPKHFKRFINRTRHMIFIKAGTLHAAGSDELHKKSGPKKVISFTQR
jgi:hypothetical protein